MISIRETIITDIDDIIRIHLSSFNKSHFTANFSPQMLHSYFECLLKSCPQSFIALSDDKIVGYVFGGLNPLEGVDHFIKKNFWKIILVFFKSPQFIKEKIVEKFFDTGFSIKDYKNIPTIYIIAVDPFFRLGIGTKLIENFEKRIRSENLFEYQLSVRKDNDKAIKFYENNGFYRTLTKRTSFCYNKSLK